MVTKKSDNCSDYFFSQLGPERLDDVLNLEELIFTTPWSKEQYAKLMSAGVCKIFGASKGKSGELAAYIAVSVNSAAGELEIYNVAVRPEQRRCGLAERLTGLVLDAALALRLERALLEVRESNVAARSLYEKLGFSQCGLRKNYYSSPTEHAVLYEYIFNLEK